MKLKTLSMQKIKQEKSELIKSETKNSLANELNSTSNLNLNQKNIGKLIGNEKKIQNNNENELEYISEITYSQNIPNYSQKSNINSNSTTSMLSQNTTNSYQKSKRALMMIDATNNTDSKLNENKRTKLNITELIKNSNQNNPINQKNSIINNNKEKLKINETINKQSNQTTNNISLLHKLQNSRLSLTVSPQQTRNPTIYDKIECNICNEICKDPCANSCGHICCATCWKLWLDNKPVCPLCRSFASIETISKVLIKNVS